MSTHEVDEFDVRDCRVPCAKDGPDLGAVEPDENLSGSEPAEPMVHVPCPEFRGAPAEVVGRNLEFDAQKIEGLVLEREVRVAGDDVPSVGVHRHAVGGNHFVEEVILARSQAITEFHERDQCFHDEILQNRDFVLPGVLR